MTTIILKCELCGSHFEQGRYYSLSLRIKERFPWWKERMATKDFCSLGCAGKWLYDLNVEDFMNLKDLVDSG